ncbi:Clp protease N-terminal domain-containing protein [Amycolatopsis sp. NPDC058278]|uniref:Clp protease N-terminal domain-containing protein n=1 Tax=Amycolatopsis sp. NPDC058278 TaxID=3346417 RepID=UPI0036DE1F95
MFEKLSAAANRALAEAAKHATSMSADDIGPTHLLLGLADDPQSVAGTELTEAGVNLEPLRRLVSAAPSTETTKSKPLALAPDLWRILDAAVRTSASANADLVTTGHILQAAIADQGSEVLQLLSELGLSVPSIAGLRSADLTQRGTKTSAEYEGVPTVRDFDLISASDGPLDDEETRRIGDTELRRMRDHHPRRRRDN